MYHSEYGQDRWINENIVKGRRDGTFVEIGALDGLTDSNSLFFEEELGWNGLCVEANPVLGRALAGNRPNVTSLSLAIFDHIGRVQFEEVRGCLGWSGIKETIEPQHWERIRGTEVATSTVEVPCTTLDQALSDARIREIDYLSIDVEGAELRILSVFPFLKFRIGVMSVEDNFGNPALDALICGNGFRKVARIGPDNIYLRASAA